MKGPPGNDRAAGPRLPAGFAAIVGHIGVRSAPADDVALVSSVAPSTSAAVFTRSRFAGPSVGLSRARAAGGRARGFVVVAGNANVATGEQGEHDAAELSALAGELAGVHASELLVASTGVIGRRYPMEAIRGWFASAGAAVAGSAGADCRRTEAALDVARAIMTTDTVPKTASRSVGPVSVVGVAKGVGMIEPDMATMLAFVLTDAAVEPDVLDRLWRRVVDRTFNCLSVDGDTSTSDAAMVFASGVTGVVPEADLAVALQEVCLDLTLQLARDGEGATKLLSVTVRGARDDAQARVVAKAIVNSPLVKTAIHGGDPNWGRVAMAVGKVDDHDIRPERVVIRFGPLEAYPSIPGPDGLDALAALLREDHVEVEVDLGIGPAEATVYGCDLSAEYVRINADYTT